MCRSPRRFDPADVRFSSVFTANSEICATFVPAGTDVATVSAEVLLETVSELLATPATVATAVARVRGARAGPRGAAAAGAAAAGAAAAAAAATGTRAVVALVRDSGVPNPSVNVTTARSRRPRSAACTVYVLLGPDWRVTAPANTGFCAACHVIVNGPRPLTSVMGRVLSVSVCPTAAVPVIVGVPAAAVFATPVPVIGTSTWPPGRLVLLIRSVAVFAPAVVGSKLTGMVHVPPAGIGAQVAAGRFASVGAENWFGAVWMSATAVIVSGVRPLFVTVTFCVTAGAVRPREPNASDGVTVAPAPLFSVTSANCGHSMFVRRSTPSVAAPPVWLTTSVVPSWVNVYSSALPEN